MCKQCRLQVRQAPYGSQAEWRNYGSYQLNKGQQEMLFDFDANTALEDIL
jgi:hypothetical protein